MNSQGHRLASRCKVYASPFVGKAYNLARRKSAALECKSDFAGCLRPSSIRMRTLPSRRGTDLERFWQHDPSEAQSVADLTGRTAGLEPATRPL
jgi:hypothetical protein